MESHLDFDRTARYAIMKEIGEGLRGVYKPEKSLPANLARQIHRLEKLDNSSKTVDNIKRK